MKKCPVCKVKLQRGSYENVTIHICDQCRGTLLKRNRLKSIESRREKTEQDLMDELVTAGPDSEQKLRCPGCLSTMEKRSKNIGNSSFFIDRCKRCDFVWLDAGELAKLQVIYEFSEKGQEALRFQERLKNMTPEERAAFEERIANLPEENWTTDVIRGVASEILAGNIRRRRGTSIVEMIYMLT